MIPVIAFLAMALVSCTSPTVQKINLKRLDLSLEEVDQKTPLMMAAEQGNRALVRQLLEQGERINSVAPSGTAFSMAVKNDHRVIARFLLSAGADWHSGFKPGEPSALIIAAERGDNNLVKELIMQGEVMDNIDEQGYSAIAKAAINGHLTTLKILIKAGANVDVAPEGRSLLMHVVDDNNILLSQQLIAAGANVNFRDEHGDTALKIARRKGYFDLDLMLVQSGARP